MKLKLMSKRNQAILLILILLIVMSLSAMISCAKQALEEPLPPTPAPVPAAPNESIVTGKVIALQSLPGNIPWEIIIEVHSSQDVPGYPNTTKQKIGQQISVRTKENAAQLKVGQVITALVRLEGDERIRFYYAWDIQ